MDHRTEQMIFLDPTSDIAFKKLFGDKERKNILIDFLNSVLGRVEGEKIVDVTIGDPHNYPKIRGAKFSIVDISCVDQKKCIISLKCKSLQN